MSAYSEKPLSYRRDIDGLRAVAVLAVLIYHLDVGAFGGGFVGVDVFFVISGYLITRIIRDEFQSTGSFSFSNFYIRRIRRLFPAMFVTLAFSFGVAIWLLPPAAFTSFAGSLASAVASVSNIWFWQEAGYFDVAARTKPLLHTWSLSVEEQFYLVWPVTLAALLAWRRPPAAVLVAVFFGAASLALNIIVTNKTVFYSVHGLRPLFQWFADPLASIFFLLPFRVFEFLIGAAVLLIEPFRPRSTWRAHALALTGLGALAYAIFGFNHETLFPSYAALLPCMGTALLLYVGCSSVLVRLYDNPACAPIGLVSYSLYLVHWPLIVFFEYAMLRPMTVAERGGIGVTSLVLAIVLYFMVERPFRRASGGLRVPNQVFVAGAIAFAFVIFAPALHAFTAAGWAWRYSPEVLAFQDNYSFPNARGGAKECFMMPDNTYKDIPAECYTIDKFSSKKKSIMVFGDSSAEHIYFGLYQLLGDKYDILLWSNSNCPATYHFKSLNNPYCDSNRSDFLTKYIKENRYDLVLMSSLLRPPYANDLYATVKTALDEAGIPFAVLGQSPAFYGQARDLVMGYGRLDGLGEFMAGRLIYPCDGDEYGLDKLAGDRFFSMKSILCDGPLPIVSIDGHLVQKDHFHLSQTGSFFVATRLVPWLRQRNLLPPEPADVNSVGN